MIIVKCSICSTEIKRYPVHIRSHKNWFCSVKCESEFKKSLEEVGFKNIKIYDKVNETLPSAKKIYKMSIFSYPVSWALEKLRITPSLLTKNNLAGITQYRIIKNGIMGHRVFYAEK